MKIVILGQGAVGLLWYQALQHLFTTEADRSHKVSIRSSAANPTARQTFTFSNLSGLSTQRPLTYANNKALSECDHLLVCVKSYQVQQALEPVIPFLNAGSTVILCHNGMGTLQELPPKISASHAILTMLTTHGCLRVKPKHIRHTGKGYSDLGLVSGQLPQTQQTALSNVLNGALPQVNWSKNIVEKQWQKLAVNCVINPLTALYQLKNGQILTNEYNGKLSAIVEEFTLVASREGIEFNRQELEQSVRAVAEATANNISSMRCDVLAGKKTEIDYINGYIHRLGEKHHIATPENTRLWQQISQMNKT